jgi:hypothetical protein
MTTARRFPQDVVTAIRKAKILGLRAGDGAHRFIGLWVVVVDGRVFVRSWSRSPAGWHATLLGHPHGVLQSSGRQLPFRAVITRSDRVKDAVSEAYRDKYRTPAALRYVRDLNRACCRATTTELVPGRP